MKRQNSRVNVSSLTVRRIDSVIASRRTVKGALTRVRGWCDRLRRETPRKDEKIEQQNHASDIKGKVLTTRMILDEEEMRNFNNENLENELRELVKKMTF